MIALYQPFDRQHIITLQVVQHLIVTEALVTEQGDSQVIHHLIMNQDLVQDKVYQHLLGLYQPFHSEYIITLHIVIITEALVTEQGDSQLIHHLIVNQILGQDQGQLIHEPVVSQQDVITDKVDQMLVTKHMVADQ